MASPAGTPPGFSSLSAVAVFVTIWAGTAAPTAYGIVIVQVAPGARLAGSAQWIVLPLEVEQSPPRSALGIPAVNAAGRMSSTTTVSASDGPLFVTVIV